MQALQEREEVVKENSHLMQALRDAQLALAQVRGHRVGMGPGLDVWGCVACVCVCARVLVVCVCV